MKSSGQNFPQIGSIVAAKIQIGSSPKQKEWEVSKFSIIANLFLKTNNLNDTNDVKAYSGYGLGFRISIPSFNEKRSKEEFARSTGLVNGYFAYDSFWNHHWRFVSDFRIDVFKIASNTVTFSLNGKVDFPLGFSGPSDIRFSILGAVNVSQISGFISSK